MSLPDPTRELAGDDALAAILDVRRACHGADGVDPLDEAASLQLARRGLSGVEAHVRADGFALRTGGRLDLAVAPTARGRGLGTTLAGAALAAPGAITAWSHADHPAAARIAARFGLDAARALWVMRRPSSVPIDPADLEPAPGITVRGFRTAPAEAAEADTAAVLRVNAAAFAEHPEQGELDAEGFAERRAEAWFDPAGLLLAVDADDRLLGFHWTKVHDPSHGEVYVLGIDPAAQGAGLGRTLTAHGLQHLAGRGVTEVLLFVEADNEPALGLYRRLGFTHRRTDTHVQYRRPVVGTS